ncbi:UNVERIFIED_CONTAM: hypothetical protein Scaly_3136600 [Sesamum calycinum]|uniref:Reverse transcriptase domain-containing protein n=1 Tax=Sesamum calycinum TaxID=2727403 RepID=A0AAW2JHF9_9LAMI
MFEAVGEFFRTGKILKQINNTLLILIPKVNMPTFVSDYRPIACCNTLYKAITKILVKRLQRVLPLMIDHSQNAFVPGRSISDNILLAQELLAGYNQARLPARCMLKVDIQKAYDSVEWDFLLETLRLFNFPQQFIILIKQCVSTASFSISLNGSIYGFFKSSRGLRQAHIPSIKVLTDTLSEFASLSGLKVNPVKSQIIFSRAVQQERQHILEYVGFQEGSLPVKYLGIPLTSSRLTFVDCRPLIDKVDARLAGAGNAKVAWDQLCKPKAEGGLGVRRLVTANQALILKQLWRILQNDGTSIWVDWIHQNRLRHTTIWTFNRDTGSWSWKKMLKLRPLLQRGVVYKVGDGSSFNLWQDIWHDRGPLCLNYPRGPASRGCLYPLHSPVCFSKTAGIGQPRQTPTLLKLYPSSLQHTLLHLIQFAGEILLNEIKFQWPYEEWQRGITWASKRWRGNHLVNAALRATLAALVTVFGLKGITEYLQQRHHQQKSLPRTSINSNAPAAMDEGEDGELVDGNHGAVSANPAKAPTAGGDATMVDETEHGDLEMKAMALVRTLRRRP